MATNTEQILMRVGMDQTGIESGTRKLLDAQKKAANDYTNFWKKAIEEKERFETDKAIEGATRRNRARELMRQREVEQARRHARDMAQVEQGYTPESWKRQQTINANYGRRYGAEMVGGNISSSVASSAAEGILSGKESGKLGKEVANAAVEAGFFGVLMAVVNGLTKSAIKKLGKGVFGGGAMSVIGPIGAAAAGVYAGMKINDAYINEPEREAQAQTSETKGILAEKVKAQLSAAMAAGAMGSDRAQALAGDLTTFRGIKRAQKELAPLMAAINAANAASAERLKIEIEHAEFAKRSAAAEKERLALQKQYNADRKQMRSLVKSYNAIDNEAPSVEQLAGRDYMAKLHAYFGQGGPMDLEAGNGPFARAAQDALYFKNKQMADVISGNAIFDKDGNLMGGAAFQDRALRMKNENMLRAAGLETPEMKQRDLIDRMSETRDAMQQLLATAKTDGIKINTGE